MSAWKSSLVLCAQVHWKVAEARRISSNQNGPKLMSLWHPCRSSPARRARACPTWTQRRRLASTLQLPRQGLRCQLGETLCRRLERPDWVLLHGIALQMRFFASVFLVWDGRVIHFSRKTVVCGSEMNSAIRAFHWLSAASEVNIE